MNCKYASSGCNYPEGECLGNCYRQNFTHLGEPVKQENPFQISDLLVIVFAVLCIAGMVSGIFAGGPR